MERELAGLAASGAAAVVQAVGTEAWADLRLRVTKLFRGQYDHSQVTALARTTGELFSGTAAAPTEVTALWRARWTPPTSAYSSKSRAARTKPVPGTSRATEPTMPTEPSPFAGLRKAKGERTQAQGWYRKAADMGHPGARRALCEGPETDAGTVMV
ncbi:hypothetical protein DY245_04480 [Streptomyces inhibens]|uniref:Sel1 repeat family protein n=1 Tax=Streptomyces inhibens TaxID=2293571 RepID=A0A371QA00_STRIH|nr:hypothetical protein DY245_04480 [Streptomyces inhibens]